MKYSKTITLKDGRTCVLRNGTEQDGQANLALFCLTHQQTDYLLSYPDEITYTAEEQAEYLKARQALDEQDFNYTAFFLQMLFKVLEHPENYSKEFVPWCAKNIELAVTTFADNRAKQAESAVQGGKNEA